MKKILLFTFLFSHSITVFSEQPRIEKIWSGIYDREAEVIDDKNSPSGTFNIIKKAPKLILETSDIGIKKKETVRFGMRYLCYGNDEFKSAIFVRWTFPEKGITNNKGEKVYNYEYLTNCKEADFEGGIVGWAKNDSEGIGPWKLQILHKDVLLHEETYNLFLDNDSALDNNESSEFDLDIKKYLKLKSKKSYAVAIDNNGRWVGGYSVNYPTQASANLQALSNCNKYRKEHKIVTKCVIYMEGNIKNEM